jgi:hypothetical protein
VDAVCSRHCHLRTTPQVIASSPAVTAVKADRLVRAPARSTTSQLPT